MGRQGLAFPHLGPPLRTTIVMDDALQQQVLQASGARTQREAVEPGLRTPIRLKQQESIRSFRAALAWQASLEELRLDR